MTAVYFYLGTLGMCFSPKPLKWTNKSFSFDTLVTWANELNSPVFFSFLHHRVRDIQWLLQQVR